MFRNLSRHIWKSNAPLTQVSSVEELIDKLKNEAKVL